MQHIYIHDRLFHIGGAEAVLFDLIRDQAKKDKLSWNIIIYTLFSDKTYINIDDHNIPIITALPWWINAIFVYFSSPHELHLPENDIIFSEENIERSTEYIWKAKHRLNIWNQVCMTVLNWLRSVIFSIFMKIFDYRNLIIFSPTLCRLLWNKVEHEDIKTVTISSFASVKNCIPQGKIFNFPVTLYLHSPMQYIWGNYDEYIKKMSLWQKIIFKPFVSHLRKRDSKNRHYDYVLCNSRYTLACAKHLYTKRQSKTSFGNAHIQYPRINKLFHSSPVSSEIKEYYVYVWRLVKFVRETDLIIRLANEVHIPLLVVWSWPDEDELKALAWDTVHFVGHVSDIQEKIDIMSKSRGLINLTKESCGIATMEALALWVPVLWYNAWATPEFVNTSNGILAETKNMEHLIEKFRAFHTAHWDRKMIKKKFLATLSN